jgi:hypothetical protein
MHIRMDLLFALIRWGSATRLKPDSYTVLVPACLFRKDA